MSLRSLLDTTDEQRRPMTQAESKAFIEAVLLDQEPTDFTSEMANGGPMALAILGQRLAWSETKISLGMAYFVASMARNPGDVVLWAFALTRLADKVKPADRLTTNDFANAFPMGIPTEEGMLDVWDGQKRHRNQGLAGLLGDAPKGMPGDNLYDVPEAWRL